MANYNDPAPGGGRRQAVLTGLFLVLGVVLINLPPEAQGQVRWLVQASVLRPFVRVQEALAVAREQAVETAVLTARLDSMVALSTARSHLVEENRRLRGLLSLSERIGTSWVAASVIRAGTMGSESIFQLNVGAAHGVVESSPVITRHGLAGLVWEVRSESALGIDWSHPDFRASAMSLDGETYGLVETYQGDFREEDRLRFTTLYTDLEPGTPIVTSGRGSVYPRGVPIGRVLDLAEEDPEWSRTYWLEPLVDPGTVAHVLVTTDPGMLSGDLSVIWPRDSILDPTELRRLEELRIDSLGILRDSVSRLRELLPDSLILPDSAGALEGGEAAGAPPGETPESGSGGGGGGDGGGGASMDGGLLP